MASLYNLNSEMRQLLSLAENGDESFGEALSDTIGVQSEMLEEKIEQTIYVAKSLQEDAEACKAEAKRLSDRARRLEGNAESCKQRVIDVMKERGHDKIKRPLITVTLAKPKKIVVIEEDAKLPTKYTKLIPASRQPVKADILKALQAGLKIKGCKLDDGKPSLRIS